MPGNFGTGFGYFNFGHAPFGTVDWALDHFSLVPQKTKEEDEIIAADRLQKFIESIAPSFNFSLDKSEKLTDLTDPDRIPIGLLKYLASTYSIELEQILSDRAQRSFVRNARKWMALKGTDLGYKIRANLSGFEVEVIPLYKVDTPVQALIDAGAVFEIPPGSGNKFTDKDPLIAFFDETPADVIPTDTYLFEFGDSPPEGVEFHDVSDCNWCKTARLRVLISAEDLDLQPDVSVSDALSSIVRKLEDVKPAHVRFAHIAFTIELNINVQVNVTLETFGTPTSNEPVIL